jgi:hypothetical protein
MLLYSEDGGKRLLRNTGTYLAKYTAQYLKIPLFPCLLPWDLQILQTLILFNLML